MERKEPGAGPFGGWLRAVNEICCRRVLLVLTDFPDVGPHAAFEAGRTPEEFFEETVLPALRELFGQAIDELLERTAALPEAPPRRRGPRK